MSLRASVIAVAALAMGLSACEGSDATCSRSNRSQPTAYDKADFLGQWDLTLEVLEDESGRLEVGPLGEPERVRLTFPEERWLEVRSAHPGAMRALFVMSGHVDGYRDGEQLCLRFAAHELEWWQRRFFQPDWTMELTAAHPALASDEERAALHLEPTYRFVQDYEEGRWLVPQLERDPATGELVRFSVGIHYYVTSSECDCPGAWLAVRFSFSRPT